MTFEAQSLRSHARYFLIENINLVVERCLLRLLCIVGAYLVQGLLNGEFVDFSHYIPLSEDETTQYWRQTLIIAIRSEPA
jgi:hypothetical protein